MKLGPQEKALVGAFSVIVKTGCGTDRWASSQQAAIYDQALMCPPRQPRPDWASVILNYTAAVLFHATHRRFFCLLIRSELVVAIRHIHIILAILIFNFAICCIAEKQNRQWYGGISQLISLILGTVIDKQDNGSLEMNMLDSRLFSTISFYSCLTIGH